MSRKKQKRGLKIFLIVLLCLVAALLIMLTVSDGDPFPNWQTLLNSTDNSASNEDDDYFKVVDVGQGDCLLFYSNGVSALIDTGIRENAVNTRNKLVDYGLGKIDALMVSHLHDDHTGGLPAISELFSIKNLIIPDIIGNTNSANDVLSIKNKLAEGVGAVYRPEQGMVIEIGDFEITVLAYYDDEQNINDQSVFMMAEIEDKKFLLTGDAEKKAEKRLLAEGIDVSCDVLKVGHHGSRTSSNSAFLDACSPDYAAISCGVGNRYSHPNKEILQRLNERKIETYRTDLNGDITFFVDNGEISVTTQR